MLLLSGSVGGAGGDRGGFSKSVRLNSNSELQKYYQVQKTAMKIFFAGFHPPPLGCLGALKHHLAGHFVLRPAVLKARQPFSIS